MIDEQCNVTKPPEQIAAQVATIRRHRNADEPFDVAVDGTSNAGENALAREYAAVGATWWFEAIFGSRGPLDAQIERIKAGPPFNLILFSFHALRPCYTVLQQLS